MNQEERRQYLLRYLLDEQPRYRDTPVPQGKEEQQRLLRSLMNVRAASPIPAAFQAVQDDYLREEIEQRGIVELTTLTPVEADTYVWRGDITTLHCGAIVNAANSGMTGCYLPCHACIDNCIHTFAGIELRNYCDDMMRRQGYPEPTGQAKITPAFNLPCRYVIHTVGPIVEGALTHRHEEQLASCYRACLRLAQAHDVGSIAFCCVSTGVFCFPNERAAEIAVQTVRAFKAETNSDLQVIFNVFKAYDEQLYRRQFA